jgi:PAS domain S-box-containing protein/putative nucleotidyltransferase with HDIG domain
LDEAEKLARLGSWSVYIASGKTEWSVGLFLLSGMQPGWIEPSIESALALVHPADRDRYAQTIQHSIDTAQPFQLEMRALKPSGEIIWVSSRGKVTTDENHQPVRIDGIVQDISERKTHDIHLTEAVNFATSILEQLPGIFVLFDEQGRIQRWNQNLLHATQYRENELYQKPVTDFFPPTDAVVIANEIERVFAGEVREVSTAIYTREGTAIPYQINAARYESRDGPTAIAIGFDRSEAANAEESLQRQLTELLILQKISDLALHLNDEDELIARATQLLSDNIYMDHCGIIIRDDASGFYRVHSSYSGLRQDALHLEFSADKGIVGRCIKHRQQLRIDDVTCCPDYISGSQVGMRSELCAPMIVGDDVIGVINAESKELAAFSAGDERLIGTAATLLGVAIQKTRLYKRERQRWLEADVQHQVSRALTMSLDLREMLENLLIGLERVIPYDSAAVFFVDGDVLRIVWGRGFPEPEKVIGLESSVSDLLFQHIKGTRAALIVDDVRQDARFLDYGNLSYVRGWMGVPLMDQGTVFGYFTLDRTLPNAFTPEQAALASTFANHAASAIMKARLFSQTQKRLSQLQALHEIDQMITTSFDLHATMASFLMQVSRQLGVDAADILRLNKKTQELDFVISNGFNTNALQHTHLPLNLGYAGKAALTGEMIHIPDLSDTQNEFSRSPAFADENFITYYAVPLVARGEVKGVLEVFHRSPLAVNTDWHEFLHILATQAAIAIDNLDLFENLQNINLELTLAYDATLEGWAKALEMRDQETEGHSMRVTELTLQLARAMEISTEELVHIRRGAMLHDIGKMGIPDSILLKPGALNEREWEIMRMHPVLAYQSLSKIPFLQPALDIPYCHHEKWDGSGYPQGLAGEAIPLPARIFAVVDVYDALSSERPYRPPWDRERVLQYIRNQSGIHFDPHIVAVFLQFLETNPGFGK